MSVPDAVPVVVAFAVEHATSPGPIAQAPTKVHSPTMLPPVAVNGAHGLGPAGVELEQVTRASSAASVATRVAMVIAALLFEHFGPHNSVRTPTPVPRLRAFVADCLVTAFDLDEFASALNTRSASVDSPVFLCASLVALLNTPPPRATALRTLLLGDT